MAFEKVTQLKQSGCQYSRFDHKNKTCATNIRTNIVLKYFYLLRNNFYKHYFYLIHLFELLSLFIFFISLSSEIKNNHPSPLVDLLNLGRLLLI